MSRTYRISFEYSERYPIGTIRYDFEAEIYDPRILGVYIGLLIFSVQDHLTTNNIWNYKLGLTISTDTISDFGVNIQRGLNYDEIYARLVDYTQSRRIILGEENIVCISITALLLHLTEENEEIEDERERQIREVERKKRQEKKEAERKKQRDLQLRVGRQVENIAKKNKKNR